MSNNTQNTFYKEEDSSSEEEASYTKDEETELPREELTKLLKKKALKAINRLCLILRKKEFEDDQYFTYVESIHEYIDHLEEEVERSLNLLN